MIFAVRTSVPIASGLTVFKCSVNPLVCCSSPNNVKTFANLRWQLYSLARGWRTTTTDRLSASLCQAEATFSPLSRNLYFTAAPIRPLRLVSLAEWSTVSTEGSVPLLDISLYPEQGSVHATWCRPPWRWCRQRLHPGHLTINKDITINVLLCVPLCHRAGMCRLSARSCQTAECCSRPPPSACRVEFLNFDLDTLRRPPLFFL